MDKEFERRNGLFEAKDLFFLSWRRWRGEYITVSLDEVYFVGVAERNRLVGKHESKYLVRATTRSPFNDQRRRTFEKQTASLNEHVWNNRSEALYRNR